MKALLYKEFKLAMHPVCYIFIFVFPLMILIPNYPLAIGFIYVLAAYPILFLGANKGQQSNDLLFSTLLPVRKKDIVRARMITTSLMQLIFILIQSILVPIAIAISKSLEGKEKAPEIPGLGFDAFVSVLGFAILGYAIADLIFFPIYYKKGKSIVMSTLLQIFGFAAFLAIFTIVIPYVPGTQGYVDFFTNNLGIQFAFLAVALAIYAVIHYFIYKISSKRLENVDF